MPFAKLLAGALCFSYAAVAQPGQLHDAIKKGDLASVRTMIAEGVDVDEVDFVSGSPLHIASVKGEFELVELLLEAGADVNSEEFGKSDTPLHWASLGGFAPIIERLRQAGADIDALNEYQNSALHIAAESGHADAARKLIELGADTSARNQKGNSAMHLAGAAQLFDIVELLKAKGAQPPPPENIGPALASASPTRGEERFMVKCIRCHALPETRKTEVAPSLWNIVDRQQAAQEGFQYSAALGRLDGIWSFENLNLLLLDSRNYFPGNAMSQGDAMDILEPQDRADIIAFLRLQSSEPVPLP
ncbi:MAG: c-type cytochrome [Rhodothermales bacterium]|nr:c-type cytochrome [Rhodothermales bacterium]